MILTEVFLAKNPHPCEVNFALVDVDEESYHLKVGYLFSGNHIEVGAWFGFEELQRVLKNRNLFAGFGNVLDLTSVDSDLVLNFKEADDGVSFLFGFRYVSTLPFLEDSGEGTMLSIKPALVVENRGNLDRFYTDVRNICDAQANRSEETERS